MKLLSIAAALVFIAMVAFAEDPASFSVGSFSFQRPATWQWVPVNSPMRKAQLKVPGKDGASAADITFFHFGSGQGGDVQSNAQRWLKQFESREGASKVETQDMNGTKVTLVTTEGIFHSGMPGGPTAAMPDQALLGAILESDEGNVFVKMTGPTSLVKEVRPQFLEFVKGATPAKK
jgi:hypothetical protein